MSYMVNKDLIKLDVTRQLRHEAVDVEAGSLYINKGDCVILIHSVEPRPAKDWSVTAVAAAYVDAEGLVGDEGSCHWICSKAWVME